VFLAELRSRLLVAAVTGASAAEVTACPGESNACGSASRIVVATIEAPNIDWYGAISLPIQTAFHLVSREGIYAPGPASTAIKSAAWRRSLRPRRGIGELDHAGSCALLDSGSTSTPSD